MSIVCNECGRNIKVGAESCLGCGTRLPDFGKSAQQGGAPANGSTSAAVVRDPNDERAIEPARCCPRQGCKEFLVEGEINVCSSCGARVAYISVDSWVRKVVRPALDADPVEAVYSREAFVRQAEEAGLSDADAEEAFQREVQRLAKAPPETFLYWFENHLQPALDEQSSVGQIRPILLSEALELKLSRRFVERVLNLRLPRLLAEADLLHFDPSMDKTSGRISIWNGGGGRLEGFVTVSTRCVDWVEVHPVEFKTEKERCSILVSIKNLSDPKPGTHDGEVTLSSNGGERTIPLTLVVGKTWFRKHKTKVEVFAALLSIPSLLFTSAFIFKDPIVRWFNKPSIGAVRVYPGSNARVGETVILKAEGLNTAPESLNCDWEIKPALAGHVEGKGPEVALTISAIDPSFSSALVEVKVRVTNRYGDSASQSTSINVVSPLPPRQVPLEPMDHPMAVWLGQRARLTARVGDFDGERAKLTYEWSCSAGHVEGRGSSVELSTAGLARNVTAIEVTLKVSSPQGSPSYDRALVSILRHRGFRRNQTRPKPTDRMFVWPRQADKPEDSR